MGHEFPDEFVQEFRERFGSQRTPATETLAEFVRRETGGRSFPTGYAAWTEDDRNGKDAAAHIALVREQLGRLPAEHAQMVDIRVWYGPGPADVEALLHIEDAYYVGLGVLDRANLLVTEPWLNERSAMVRAMPAVLDLVVRNVAQRLARDREGLQLEDAQVRYGWDPYRIAIEHGQPFDMVDALMARSGLRGPGSTCPSPAL